MVIQKHKDVLDLYHFLGIDDISSINTTLSLGNINGDAFQEVLSEEIEPKGQDALTDAQHNN